jgi:hypothetical protein
MNSLHSLSSADMEKLELFTGIGKSIFEMSLIGCWIRRKPVMLNEDNRKARYVQKS